MIILAIFVTFPAIFRTERPIGVNKSIWVVLYGLQMTFNPSKTVKTLKFGGLKGEKLMLLVFLEINFRQNSTISIVKKTLGLNRRSQIRPYTIANHFK